MPLALQGLDFPTRFTGFWEQGTLKGGGQGRATQPLMKGDTASLKTNSGRHTHACMHTHIHACTHMCTHVSFHYYFYTMASSKDGGFTSKLDVCSLCVHVFPPLTLARLPSVLPFTQS